jgi:hypothetical protein
LKSEGLRVFQLELLAGDAFEKPSSPVRGVELVFVLDSAGVVFSVVRTRFSVNARL